MGFRPQGGRKVRVGGNNDLDNLPPIVVKTCNNPTINWGSMIGKGLFLILSLVRDVRRSVPPFIVNSEGTRAGGTLISSLPLLEMERK